ncbi:hypothetical protein [Pseudooceanicola sp.]|uniref:hypothetical protein n=1 Tax=Pseudooceanicola sp. TaxID=1914328 RepID=UPI00351378BE
MPRQPLIVSLVGKTFRDGGPPNFTDMAQIIYAREGVEYLDPAELIANADQVDSHLASRFGRVPDVIIGFESYGRLGRAVAGSSAKFLLITEDLHLRPLESILEACEAADLVLARFDMLRDLTTRPLPHVKPFPLHCTARFLAEPHVAPREEIVDFGRLFATPPPAEGLVSTGVNQYAYRQEWHDILTSLCDGRYSHIRVRPDVLAIAMRKFGFGFACTYFPPIIPGGGSQEPLSPARSYFVAKFFEIPGAGLLLLADPAGVESFLEEYGFVAYENFIPMERSDPGKAIRFCFDPANREEILRVRRNGNDLIRNRHSIEARTEVFGNHLEALLSQPAKS